MPVHPVLVDDVQVSTYEYPSEKALADVRDSISSDGYSVPTESGGIAIVEWVATPHLYGAGRLLVVYVGVDRRTLEALGFLARAAVRWRVAVGREPLDLAKASTPLLSAYERI